MKLKMLKEIFSNFLKNRQKEMIIIEAIYGILSAKHKLQGWCFNTYWIKYAANKIKILNISIKLREVLYLIWDILFNQKIYNTKYNHNQNT